MTAALVGLAGAELLPAEAEGLRRHRLAGVLLLRRNVRSEEQLVRLCREVDACVREARGHPALVALDQEGGAVAPLAPLIGETPSARSLGRHGDLESTARLHRWTAARARRLGVNFLLAPVVDVDRPGNPVIATRAFGPESTTVTAHGRAALRGLREGGVRGCLKHWPGHGAARHDSHHRLPRLELTREELQGVDLPPFFCDPAADAIMVAHLDVPALDGEAIPTSASPRVVEKLLRREHGFAGLVVSDALEMEAFATVSPARALRAGCDLVLLATPLGELDSSVLEELEAESKAEGTARIERVAEPLPGGEGDPGGLPWSWASGLLAGPSRPALGRWGLLDLASADRLLRPPPVDGVPWQEDEAPWQAGGAPTRSPLREEWVEAWTSEPAFEHCRPWALATDAEVEPLTVPRDLDLLVVASLRPLPEPLLEGIRAAGRANPRLGLVALGAVGPDFQPGDRLWPWSDRPWLASADLHPPARRAVARALAAPRP